MAYDPPKAALAVRSDKPPAQFNPAHTVAIERTSRKLRDVLFEEIELIRSGDYDHKRAAAISNLVGGVIKTVKMEIDVGRFLRALGPESPYAEIGGSDAVSPAEPK